MQFLGIVFSNIHNLETFEVTRNRTFASTPVGGRYRLIDFPLSNLTNAGINSIGILTKNNYQSLMDHLGSGKEWDLARKRGGLVILPPYGVSDTVYSTRLEAIKGIISFINHSNADYVVMTDCYHICNVDYKEVIKAHLEKNADITVVYHKHEASKNSFTTAKVLTLDENDRITKMDLGTEETGPVNVSIDIWVMKKSLLQEIVKEAIQTNAKSFNRDVLRRNLKNYKIYGCEYKGYYGNISDLRSYYDVNMDLLNKDIRGEIFFKPGKAIYTKVRDSAPTKYSETNYVENSLIADGCEIDGTVINSVIFRGAKVCKGAVVKNCILMQDTYIAEDVNLEYVITDKNVKIINKKEIIGSLDDLVYVNKDGNL